MKKLFNEEEKTTVVVNKDSIDKIKDIKSQVGDGATIKIVDENIGNSDSTKFARIFIDSLDLDSRGTILEKIINNPELRKEVLELFAQKIGYKPMSIKITENTIRKGELINMIKNYKK
jgi:hypothetical protein